MRDVAQVVGYKGLQVLVNNTAINIPTQLDDLEPEHMNNLFQINTLGPVMLTKVCSALSTSGVSNYCLLKRKIVTMVTY